MLAGGPFPADASVLMSRLADGPPGTPRDALTVVPMEVPGTPVAPLQRSESCIKAVVPSTFQPGIVQVQCVSTTGASPVQLLNAPEIWWMQGDQTATASPGGWLRLFGPCLARPDSGKASQVFLVAPEGTEIALSATVPENALKTGSGLAKWAYSLRCPLPKTLAPGTYAVWVHNGFGGKGGWRNGGVVEVKTPPVWPQTRFDLTTYLRKTDGNIQKAVELAIADIKANDGGILAIPAGNFTGLTTAIDLPPRTVLQGAGSDRTFLHWQHTPDEPPVALVRGDHSFAVRDVSLDAQNHAAGIITKPDSKGDVWIERVYLYMNRLKQIDPRHFQNKWKEKIVESSFQDEAPALYLSGPNVHLTDSRVWTTGSLMVFYAMSGEVARNRLLAPVVNGGYRVEGCRDLVLEQNEVSSGGCIATYNHSPGRFIKGEDKTPRILTRSRNIYWSDNLFKDSWRFDAEVMTVDFHPPVNIYAGPLASGGPDRIVLPEPHALFAFESQRSARRMEPGKTYTLVLKIQAYKGDKWDQCYLKVYGPGEALGDGEPETWDSTDTVRDSKVKYDQLQVSGTKGISVSSFAAGRTWKSVLGQDAANVVVAEGFQSADKWKGDRNLSQALPPGVSVAGGVLTIDSAKGWGRAFLPVDARVIDLDQNAVYYAACTVSASEACSFLVGLEDTVSQKAGFDRTRVAMGASLLSPPPENAFAGTWKDALVYIMDGKGAGQVRHITRANGAELLVDRPWDVVPDSSSFIVIPKSFEHGLFVRNTFQESGIFNFWGGSFDQIIDGNLYDRSHSAMAMGLGVYGGMVPSARCQLLNNARIEPSGFSISGSGNEPRYTGPMFRLGVVRGNRDGTAGAGSSIRDTIVEDNVNTITPSSYAEWIARKRNAGMVLVSEEHEAERDHLTWVDPIKGLVSRNNQPATPWGNTPRVYVNAAVETSGDGLSWNGALKTLQEGVERATALDIDMVYVAAGTYTVASAKDKEGLRIRHHIYGGFAGNEPAWYNLDARAISQHETILTREGKGPVLFSHNTPGIVLDGLTITGGTGDRAGGLRITQPAIGEPGRIANCRFLNNQGKEAGAIAVERAGPAGRARLEIRHCVFESNSAATGPAKLKAGPGVDITVSGGTLPTNDASQVVVDQDSTITERPY
jgi:hypothetical protein